ncbi:M1 aminopeptidase family protein [Methylocystis suflitae]|uniref:hypothetical protein n=1 Tax=Methylocystis suflitae TaxID=2951405 RepID=UPI00210BA9D2|nr:hypothetical protein [Methylocystis suflitae]MCQ4188464.1 hypothetical protein [Methylocystis suflitae]
MPRIMAKAWGLGLAFIAAALLALALRPDLRLAARVAWNDPRLLPAFADDARVHYEPEALACAEAVAEITPRAIAQIEAAHGRPFAQPPIVGVYASYENYANANAMDDPGIAAVTRGGAALLSPTLCSKERDRLEGVLAHELSHVHLSSWRPLGAPRPPQWFSEGLAVMASNGGGAEGVSEAEAAQAIRDGYRVVLDERRWIDFARLAFEREPPRDPSKDALTQRQRSPIGRPACSSAGCAGATRRRSYSFFARSKRASLLKARSNWLMAKARRRFGAASFRRFAETTLTANLQRPHEGQRESSRA